MTSYRSSVETIALNCLVFETTAFLQFGDRQTNRDRQTDEQMDTPMHVATLAVASGLIIILIIKHQFVRCRNMALVTTRALQIVQSPSELWPKRF